MYVKYASELVARLIEVVSETKLSKSLTASATVSLGSTQATTELIEMVSAAKFSRGPTVDTIVCLGFIDATMEG